MTVFLAVLDLLIFGVIAWWLVDPFWEHHDDEDGFPGSDGTGRQEPGAVETRGHGTPAPDIRSRRNLPDTPMVELPVPDGWTPDDVLHAYAQIATLPETEHAA